jgi:hypothetical protein
MIQRMEQETLYLSRPASHPICLPSLTVAALINALN